MIRRTGSGRRVAVGAAVGLMTAVLVGAPLYLSSVGSAALAIQLDASCLTDLGLHRAAPTPGDLERLDAATGEIPNLSAPTVSREAFVMWVPSNASGSVAPRRAVPILARPGHFDEVDASAIPAVGEVLIPEWAQVDGLETGSTIEIVPAFRTVDESGRPVEPSPRPVRVVGTYATIPTRPESPFWCSYREALRFSAFGDPPPPLLLTVAETFDSLDSRTWMQVWQVTPDPDGLRRDEARTTLAALEALRASEDERASEVFGVGAGPVAPVELATPLQRSDQVADFVTLTIAPLRYAGVLVALVLIAGAAVMVARADRRELELRVLRGLGSAELARGQLRWLVPVTLVGALAGVGLGWAAVRMFGPSPHLEPAAVREGVVAALVGWILATLVAAVVIAATASRSVDAPARRRRVSVRAVVEVVIVALAVWSFVRLDQHGGVRQIGVQVRGGDLLAQAFPLLGAVALVVVVSRPLTALLQRARRHGTRLPPAALLGLRRSTAEPSLTVAVLLATALATAVAFQASALTRSVDQLLADKARTQIGADLAVYVLEPTSSTEGIGAAATEMIRVDAADRAGRLFGIDPATFEAATFWRDDAADASLDELIDRLASAPNAAIAVDPTGGVDLGPTTLPVRNGELEVDVVGTARFFPGYTTGPPVFVVDRELLDNRGERVVLVRAPEVDASALLTERGSRVTNTVGVGDIFDGTNFLSAKWSYATLTAFAILLGAVTLVGQVLVLESRLRSRRVAHVLMRPMGLTRRQELGASLVEVGAPLAVGIVLGAVIGYVIARLSLGRLDSLRTMQPPARLVVDVGVLVAVAGIVAVVTVVFAVVATVRAGRDDPAEVMRFAER